DLVPSFRAEGTAFPTNDIALSAIDMKAKTIGVLTSASIELLADSPMASDMLVAALTGSMAAAIDKAMLQGDGNVVSPSDNPRGILAWPAINSIAAVGAPTNYDKWLDAISLIEQANMEPNAVIDNPIVANSLRKLKTGISVTDMSSLVPPPAYADLDK